MTGRRFKDFDSAFAEADRAPLTVRMFGVEWELPATQPASVTLRAMRAAATVREFRQRIEAAGLKPGDDLPDDFEFPDGWDELDSLSALTHAAEIVGQDNLDAWVERGIGTDELREVVEWASSTQRGEDTDDEGTPAGEAVPPAAGAPKPTARKRSRSSSTGGRSKRTSAASTRSGSPRKSV